MRDRRTVVLLGVLGLIVLVVVLFGGRIEAMLLQMHGVHPADH